jgi:hypothetical protein
MADPDEEVKVNKNFGWVSRSERKGHAVFVVGDPTSTELPSLIFELGVRPKRNEKPVAEHAPIAWSEIARIATGETTLEQLKEAAK